MVTVKIGEPRLPKMSAVAQLLLGLPLRHPQKAPAATLPMYPTCAEELQSLSLFSIANAYENIFRLGVVYKQITGPLFEGMELFLV